MPDPDPGPPASPTARKPREWDRYARPAPPPRSRQLLTALFLFAVVAGLLVWFYLIPKTPPPPRLFSMAVEQFTDPRWPAAGGVGEDSKRLAAIFPAAGGTDTVTREGAAIRSLVGNLGETTTDGPLILHVAGLAAVRNDSVGLIPSDDKAADRGAGWVPVADILDAIDRCPTKHKLLLLDVARPVGNPFSGQLRDDTAAVLDRLLTARKPKYPVLTSCGPGQFSHPVAAPEKGSAFGMYLTDGLRGLADGADGGDRNDRVTVGELKDFTRARVARYAQTVWGAAQVPQFYEPAAPGWDFPLTAGQLDPVKSHEPADEPAKYPDELHGRWAFLNGLEATGENRSNPFLYARLVGELLREERRWLATGDVGYATAVAERPDKQWRPGQMALAPRAGQADWQIKVETFRLAARTMTKPFPPDWEPALNAYLVEYKALLPKAEPTQPELTKLEAAKSGWQTKSAANLDLAAAFVWRQASRSPRLTRADLRAYATALKEVWGDKPDTLETVYLRALGNIDFPGERGIPRHPEAAVAAALLAEDRLGAALAAGPDGFAAVKDRLTAADQTRQDAMLQLFEATTTAATDRAAELFRQAADGFAQAGQSARQTVAADRATADALAGLVDTLPFALGDEETLRLWSDTAREAKGLVAGQNDPATRDRVTDGLRRLVAPFDKAAVQKLLDEEKQRKESQPWTDVRRKFPPYLRLVASPALSADQRREVWELVRKKQRELHNIAREADDKDDQERRPTPKPEPADPPADRLTKDRAESALALLELTASPGAAKARAAVSEFLEKPGGAQAEAAGTALAEAWADVRTGRFFPPDVAVNPAAGPPQNSRPAAGRASADEYLKWVAQQLEGYQPLRGADPDNKFFGRLWNLTPN